MQDIIGHARADLTDLALTGLTEAQSQGADGCKIVVGMHHQCRLVVESGELSLASTLETRNIGVQVFKDQKKGSFSMNSVSKASLKKAVADALALARFSVADPYLVLPTASEAPKAKALDFFYEEALATLEPQAMQELMLETLSLLKQDPRVALDRYELSLDVSWSGLFNSLGVQQDIRQAMASWMFMGMARDGEQVTGMDYESYFSYQAHGLKEKSLANAREFSQKLLKSLNPSRAPSYKGVVVFSPRAVSEVILDFVLYHAGGRQVMDQKSRWMKEGERVLSSLVTIVDDPHSPLMSHASTYDGDGLPTRKQTIIDHGVLKTILHDCYSAKRCQTQSKGTAGAPFGCRIQGGDRELSSLLRDYEQVLLVDRFSGNTDPVDGSFSGVAKSSRLYRHGEDQGPVIETMISGNFFDLAHKIVALSKEKEIVGGAVESPYFVVDGISVTGADS